MSGLFGFLIISLFKPSKSCGTEETEALWKGKGQLRICMINSLQLMHVFEISDLSRESKSVFPENK